MTLPIFGFNLSEALFKSAGKPRIEALTIPPIGR